MQGSVMGSTVGLDQAVENQSILVNQMHRNYNSELQCRLKDPCGKCYSTVGTCFKIFLVWRQDTGIFHGSLAWARTATCIFINGPDRRK